jgi:hypothetical protein
MQCKNIVDVIANELPSQITFFICLMIFGLDNVDAHQRGFMRFNAICPKWQASSEIDVKIFQLYYGHP